MEQLIAQQGNPETPTSQQQLQRDHLDKTGQSNVVVFEQDPFEVVNAQTIQNDDDELGEEEDVNPNV